MFAGFKFYISLLIIPIYRCGLLKYLICYLCITTAVGRQQRGSVHGLVSTLTRGVVYPINEIEKLSSCFFFFVFFDTKLQIVLDYFLNKIIFCNITI